MIISHSAVRIFCRRIVVLVSTAAALLATGNPAQAEVFLPDLTIDGPRIAASMDFKTRTFSQKDCAVIEGCVGGTGKRLLLRFDVATPNIGNAHLALGDPQNNPLFEYSPCHGHYHFSGYALYELLTTSGELVVIGRKQAFCLLDYQPYLANAGPGQFTCENQGISAGWQDVYGKYLDCQWLDVTGVAPGDYLLRVMIDPGGVLPDSNRNNNSATVPVTIPGKGRH